MSLDKENMAPIELERQMRIKENQDKMKELGLFDKQIYNTVRRESGAGYKFPMKRRRRESVQEPLPIRKSTRVKKQAMDLKQVMYDEVLQDTKTKTKSKPQKQRAVHKGDRFEGWHPNMSQCSQRSTDKATDEAIAYLEAQQLIDNGGMKVMTQSMVSGGFWCSLDRDFGVKMDKKDNGGRYYFNKSLTDYKRVVYLHVMDEPDDDGEKAPVVLLGKGALKKDTPVSYGFSGGWRGFAIKQLLYPGDVLAFWRLDDTNIGVRIFRGMSFESNNEGWKQGQILLKTEMEE